MPLFQCPVPSSFHRPLGAQQPATHRDFLAAQHELQRGGNLAGGKSRDQKYGREHHQTNLPLTTPLCLTWTVKTHRTSHTPAATTKTPPTDRQKNETSTPQQKYNNNIIYDI